MFESDKLTTGFNETNESLPSDRKFTLDGITYGELNEVYGDNGNYYNSILNVTEFSTNFLASIGSNYSLSYRFVGENTPYTSLSNLISEIEKLNCSNPELTRKQYAVQQVLVLDDNTTYYSSEIADSILSTNYAIKVDSSRVLYTYSTKVSVPLVDGTNCKIDYSYSNKLDNSYSSKVTLTDTTYPNLSDITSTIKSGNAEIKTIYNTKLLLPLTYSEVQSILPVLSGKDNTLLGSISDSVVYDNSGTAHTTVGLDIRYTFTDPITGTNYANIEKLENEPIQLDRLFKFDSLGQLVELDDTDTSLSFFATYRFASKYSGKYNYISSNGNYYYYTEIRGITGVTSGYILSMGKVQEVKSGSDILVYNYNSLVKQIYVDSLTGKTYQAYQYVKTADALLNANISTSVTFENIYYGITSNNTRINLIQKAVSRVHTKKAYIRTAYAYGTNQKIDILGKTIMTSTKPIIYPSFFATAVDTDVSSFITDFNNYYTIDYSTAKSAKYGLPGVTVLSGAPYPNTVISFSVRHKLGDNQLIRLGLKIDKVYSVELGGIVTDIRNSNLATPDATYGFKDTKTNVDQNNYPDQIVAVTDKSSNSPLYSSYPYSLANSTSSAPYYVPASFAGDRKMITSRDITNILTYPLVDNSFAGSLVDSSEVDLNFMSNFMFYDKGMLLLCDKTQNSNNFGSGMNVHSNARKQDNYRININGKYYYYSIASETPETDSYITYNNLKNNNYAYYLHYSTPLDSIPSGANPFDYTKVNLSTDSTSASFKSYYFEKVKLTTPSGSIIKTDKDTPYYVYTTSVADFFTPYAFSTEWIDNSASTDESSLRYFLLNEYYVGTNVNRYTTLTKSHYRYNVLDDKWYEIVYNSASFPCLTANYNSWSSSYTEITNAPTLDIHTYTTDAFGNITLTSECSTETICGALDELDSNAVTNYGNLVISGITSAYRTGLDSVSSSASNYQGLYAGFPYSIKNATLATNSFFTIGEEQVILVTNPNIVISNGLSSVVYRFKEWGVYTRYNSEILYRDHEAKIDGTNTSTFTFSSALAKNYVFLPIYERVYSLTLSSVTTDGVKANGGVITTYYKDGARVNADSETIEDNTSDINFIEYNPSGTVIREDGSGKTDLIYDYEKMDIENYVFTTEYQYFKDLSLTSSATSSIEKYFVDSYTNGKLSTTTNSTSGIPYMVEREIGSENLEIGFTNKYNGLSQTVYNIPGVNYGVVKIGKDNLYNYYLYSLTSSTGERTLYKIHYSNGRYFFMLDSNGNYVDLVGKNVLYDVNSSSSTAGLTRKFASVTDSSFYQNTNGTVPFALRYYSGNTKGDFVAPTITSIFNGANNIQVTTSASTFVYYFNPVEYLFDSGLNNATYNMSSAKLDRGTTNNLNEKYSNLKQLNVNYETLINQIYTTRKSTSVSDSFYPVILNNIYFDVYKLVNINGKPVIRKTADGEKFARKITNKATYVSVKNDESKVKDYYISSESYYSGTDETYLTQYFDRHTTIKLMATSDEGYRFVGWYFATYNIATGEYVIKKDEFGKDEKITSSEYRGYTDEIKQVEYDENTGKYLIITGYNSSGKKQYLLDANGNPEYLPTSLENLYTGTY